MSIRHYLFPEGAVPLRLSHRLVNGLIFGSDWLPQYAGTRQRSLTAFLEMSEGKPVRILGAEGSYWDFDAEGGISEGLRSGIAHAMEIAFTTSRPDDTVVELNPRLQRKKFREDHRWEPTKDDLDRISKDIWQTSKADALPSAKGTTKRKPPLTYEAKHALQEISGGFWKISHAMHGLSEPSLRGLAFEARSQAKGDPDHAPLYLAIGEMADDRLKLQQRRRSMKGVWYAVLDILRWQDDSGEVIETFHERCQGKAMAEAAARRLLKEHADKFSAEIKIETELLTDLEWERRGF